METTKTTPALRNLVIGYSATCTWCQGYFTDENEGERITCEWCGASWDKHGLDGRAGDESY